MRGGLGTDAPPSPRAAPSRFIGRLRAFIHSRNLAYATEKTYVHWMLRYIRFHGRKPPQTLSVSYVDAFLPDLSVRVRMWMSSCGGHGGCAGAAGDRD